MASTVHWHLGCENLNLKTFHLSFDTWILIFYLQVIFTTIIRHAASLKGSFRSTQSTLNTFPHFYDIFG